MTSNIQDIITEFRMQTLQHVPWFTPYVYALTPVSRPGLGTMAVDTHGYMYYDPVYSAGLNVNEGAYVCLHEAMHLLLRHCHRFQAILAGRIPTERERFAWNIAADIAVWEVLEKIAHHAPADGGVTLQNTQAKWPSIQPGMSVEQLYSIVLNEKPDEPEDPDGGNAGDAGDERQDDRSSGTPGEGTAGGGDEQEAASDEAGEGAGVPGESGTDDQGSPGDSEDAGTGTAGDNADGGDLAAAYPNAVGGSSADGIKRDYECEPNPAWESYVEDSALKRTEEKMAGSAPGDLPGGLHDFVKNRLRPAPDPFKALQAVVGSEVSASRACPTPTYMIRSRRQVDGGALLKGYRQQQPKTVCIVDTSGSMTTECKRKSVNAVQQGAIGFGRLLVVFGDTQPQKEVFATSITNEFDFVGGGGTCMKTIIEYVEKTYQPTAIVCCTDGGTGWPESMKARLVIALTDKDYQSWCPKYAKVICIPNGKKD